MDVMTGEALAIVEAWQEAINRGDVARLRALSDPAIAIVGPRGVATGVEVLLNWLGRAGLTLTTRGRFARGGVVVLAQHGVWRDPATGATRGEAEVASHFRVADGRVAHYERRDTLAEALTAAGLTAGDAVAG
jgi:ketosteroid isomerase-like protein